MTHLPRSLGTIPRGDRENSSTPKMASSSCSDLVIAGCDSEIWWAALRSDPWSSSAMSSAIWAPRRRRRIASLLVITDITPDVHLIQTFHYLHGKGRQYTGLVDGRMRDSDGNARRN